jgi:CRP-like cAMP-binding protein
MATEVTLGRNRLLEALIRIAPGTWQDDLRWVDLTLGEVLHEPRAIRKYVYFPITAVVSLLYVLSDGDMTELCVIGNEGVVGTSSLMSDGTTASCAMVQCAGTALRLSTGRLQEEFGHRGNVAELLLRYTQVLVVQMAQTAVCNRHHTIDEQLCRWILIMLDRLPSDSIATTQEMIAATLGVRRASVNMAASQLQKEGLITSTRGKITVENRHAMEARVCECYAVIKFEYDRLAQAFDAIPTDRSHISVRNDKTRLATLHTLHILDSPSEKFFDDIAARTNELLTAPIVTISFIDHDRDWFKSCVGFDQTESPANTSFSDVLFDVPEDMVVVENTLVDRRFSEHPLVLGMPFVRFYAAARLAVNGQTIGALCAYDFKARRLTGEQVRSFESLASATKDELIARKAANI